MLPDYFNYLLTGIKKQEFTNATSTSLVNAFTKDWDETLIEAMGFPKKIFSKISQPGTKVGHFSEEIKDKVGFDCEVIMCASHDTASAFLSVPQEKNEKSIILSSGTWSLMGVILDESLISPLSEKLNFTNEGGAGHSVRFLKNIPGMWIIQSLSKEFNITDPDFAMNLAKEGRIEKIYSPIDLNSHYFASPQSMTKAVADYCHNKKIDTPESQKDYFNLVFESLSGEYANTFESIKKLTMQNYTSIKIIGGGSRNSWLCQLTADKCKIPVITCHKEGTAIGNIMVQLLSEGKTNRDELYKVVKNSYEEKIYYPSEITH